MGIQPVKEAGLMNRTRGTYMPQCSAGGTSVTLGRDNPTAGQREKEEREPLLWDLHLPKDPSPLT